MPGWPPQGGTKIDATPVDGVLNRGISSDWAFDHEAAYDAHIINYNLHTKTVIKTADETVNNSDTLQNDDELYFAIAANEIWVVEFDIFHNSSATADIKFAVVAPSGATVHTYFLGYRASAALAKVYRAGGGVSTDVDGVAGDTLERYLAVIINGSTAGNVQLQWAQNTQDASNTKVLANSMLRATKMQ